MEEDKSLLILLLESTHSGNEEVYEDEDGKVPLPLYYYFELEMVMKK